MLTGTYHYLLGPVAGFVVVALLLGLSRWTFGSGRPRSPRPTNVEPRDYGLLVPVATVAMAEDAEMLRRVLVDHGIRATVVADGSGAARAEPAPVAASTEATAPPAGVSLQVLVFRDQAMAARNLLLPR